MGWGGMMIYGAIVEMINLRNAGRAGEEREIDSIYFRSHRYMFCP